MEGNSPIEALSRPRETLAERPSPGSMQILTADADDALHPGPSHLGPGGPRRVDLAAGDPERNS